MTLPALKTCPECGCYLSAYNKGLRCWPCQEKIDRDRLFPPVSVKQVNKDVKHSIERKKYPSYNRTQKGKCDCCRRGPLTLTKCRAGMLCADCKDRIVGIFGDALVGRLAEIRVEAREYEKRKRRRK